jgi:hypothetical protein
MSRLDVNRREFMKIAAGAGAVAAMPAIGHTAVSSKMIGIQVGAVSFVDEGTEKVLDILQERGGVNTLFLAVFTYGRGIAGRQIPGQPLPDHGKQEYDLNFHGGNFATPHPQYYKNTVIQPAHAPDHGDLDILAEVLPAAKKRGLKVICWMEDVFRSDLPNIEKVQERDLYGRNRDTLCVSNPNYLNFFTGLVEDYTRSYDIDGIMWGSERQGALSDSLGATHDTPPIDPGNVTCFCEFCQRKAKDRGINVERGLIAAAMVTHADGFAERDAALLMLHEKQQGRSPRITVGADKAYDSKDFVAAVQTVVLDMFAHRRAHTGQESEASQCGLSRSCGTPTVVYVGYRTKGISGD